MADQPRSTALVVGLAVVLTVAFLLRVYGIGFGLPHLYYWDEPSVVERAIRFGSGDLNPHFFYYPALYMYVLFGAIGTFFVGGWLLGRFASPTDFAVASIADPTGVYLTARLTTAVVGTLCVLMTYRVGRRYLGRRTGLAGATFLAVAVLSSTHSHIAITDVPQSFFILAALLPLEGIMARGRWRDYLLCGALIGLGAATKYLASLLLVAALLAHSFGPTLPRRSAGAWSRLTGVLLAPRLWAAGAAAALAFMLASPFTVIDMAGFWADAGRQRTVSGWTASSGSLSVMAEAMLASFGWPLGLVCAAGVVLLAARKRNWVFLCFPAVYVVFVSGATRLFPRYLIAVEPLLAIAGGYAVVRAVDAIAPRWLPERGALAALAVAVAVLAAIPFAATLRWDVAMARDVDTRTLALEWAERSIPAGTPIAIQSLYGRTYFNVPLMTDERLRTVARRLSETPRLAGLRAQLHDNLAARPVYAEVGFEYDLSALKAAGARYLFVSDQNWPDVVSGQAPATSRESVFKSDLETRAILVERFRPRAVLGHPLLAASATAFPQWPPEISVYELAGDQDARGAIWPRRPRS